MPGPVPDRRRSIASRAARAANSQQLAATYADATLVFAQEEPFWKEIASPTCEQAPNLFAVTTDWLASR